MRLKELENKLKEIKNKGFIESLRRGQLELGILLKLFLG